MRLDDEITVVDIFVLLDHKTAPQAVLDSFFVSR